jgi:hypothetical protein
MREDLGAQLAELVERARQGELSDDDAHVIAGTLVIGEFTVRSTRRRVVAFRGGLPLSLKRPIARRIANDFPAACLVVAARRARVAERSVHVRVRDRARRSDARLEVTQRDALA